MAEINLGRVVGTDANVTKSKIESVLGYTPAKQGGLTELKTAFDSKFPDNAGAHNSIYRGKYLGSAVTVEQYAAIADGTFKDMYIGDYWTIGGVNWRIAAFNYHYNTGDTALTRNHVTIVPDTALYNHRMNPTHVTTGGYVNSEMYTDGLEQAKATIRGIFGSHLVSHRQLLANATSDGKASGWAWYSSEVELMNEVMVCGSIVWGESTIGGSGYNIGTRKSQLPLFTLRPDLIGIRATYWLSDIASAAYFVIVYYSGLADCVGAGVASGVRPVFSIS